MQLNLGIFQYNQRTGQSGVMPTVTGGFLGFQRTFNKLVRTGRRIADILKHLQAVLWIRSLPSTEKKEEKPRFKLFFDFYLSRLM